MRVSLGCSQSRNTPEPKLTLLQITSSCLGAFAFVLQMQSSSSSQYLQGSIVSRFEFQQHFLREVLSSWLSSKLPPAAPLPVTLPAALPVFLALAPSRTCSPLCYLTVHFLATFPGVCLDCRPCFPLTYASESRGLDCSSCRPLSCIRTMSST